MTTRYAIPLTILTTVTVDAQDRQSAINAAVRFAELSGPSDGFVDGWNSALEAGAPRIHDAGSVDVEYVSTDDGIEETPLCRAADCDNAIDDGEGWDGLCGSCADRAAGGER